MHPIKHEKEEQQKMQRKAMRRKKKPSRIFSSQHSPFLPHQLFLPVLLSSIYTYKWSLNFKSNFNCYKHHLKRI